MTDMEFRNRALQLIETIRVNAKDKYEHKHGVDYLTCTPGEAAFVFRVTDEICTRFIDMSSGLTTKGMRGV